MAICAADAGTAVVSEAAEGQSEVDTLAAMPARMAGMAARMAGNLILRDTFMEEAATVYKLRGLFGFRLTAGWLIECSTIVVDRHY